MAVKASANITLTSVVDIQASYRYYLLQSSTLAKPAKPTTYPPSSSWSDSEPTYVNGSTNSLYFVDLTVFSDETYAYSEVSLSTAYEAAKVAYNKAEAANKTATDAKNEIDNLEVGGRNLLTDSDITLTVTGTGTAERYSSSSIGPYGLSEKLTDLTVGDVFTLSVFVKMENAVFNHSGSNRVGFEPNINGVYYNCWHTVEKGTPINFVGRINYARRIESELTLENGQPWLYIQGLESGTVTVSHPKLEKGNKATDWTPAPEDVNGKIDNATGIATEAKDKIDNLEVGGTNLFRDTKLMGTKIWRLASSRVKDIGREGVDEDGFMVIKAEESTGDNYNPTCRPYTDYQPLYKDLRGKQITFSLEVDTTATYINIEHRIMNTEDVYKKYFIRYIPLSGQAGWQRVSETLTLTDDLFDTGDGEMADDDTFVIITKPHQTPVYRVRKIKMELGNKATDWSPAPEDVDDGINNATEIATNANATANNNTVRLNDAALKIDAINAMLSTLVTGQNGETLMTQTDNGWTFNIADMQNLLGRLSTSVDGLNTNMTDASSRLDNLDQNIADLGEYTDYIKFGIDNGKPCIILGEADSSFKVVITNTNIRFMEGSVTPASISNQALNIETAIVNGELQQGGFAWVCRSNGHYSLLWKG
ncbi:hypothetical protein [Fibrobacter sp.]|uniref:hypothetical protein n=1 Tax=Fibrobacter sp. TaxID=35828 RepID=UPI0038906764